MIAHGLQKWGTYTVITTCLVVCHAVNLRLDISSFTRTLPCLFCYV